MDGNEVLKVFDQAPVDLVILDLNMPGMSGMDTLMQLTKRLDAFNVPVLIVSAEDSEESIHDGLSSGASEYIIKPFKSAELLAKVRIALKKRDAREVSDMGMALGSRFAGRYLIQDRIGSGGFSTVFRAVDTHSEEEETVALKILICRHQSATTTILFRLFCVKLTSTASCAIPTSWNSKTSARLMVITSW